MSIILDALKKAESERNIGAVPHVHIQPLPHAPAPMPVLPVRSGQGMLVALLGAALLIAGLLLWWFWRSPVPAAPVVPVVPTMTTVTPVPTVPAVPVATVPTTIAAARPPVPAMAARQDPAPAAVSKAPANRAETQPTGTVPQPAATNAAPPAAAAAPAEETLPTLRDLPDTTRQSIPAFKVGGYIYADRAADRSVLINGRLLREGDQVSPDLVLEKMTRNGLVLNFRGQRFRSSY